MKSVSEKIYTKFAKELKLQLQRQYFHSQYSLVRHNLHLGSQLRIRNWEQLYQQFATGLSDEID